MLPNYIVQDMVSDQTAALKALSEFNLAALHATQEITENTIAAMGAGAKTVPLKETCIRNIEALAKLWEPFHIHPTT